MKYYAIYAEGDYLETGLNCTSLDELKEELLSYIEFDYDEEERRTWDRLQKMSVHDIAAHKGWTIDESNTPFETVEL